MKKTICFVLAVLMSLSLIGCGRSEDAGHIEESVLRNQEESALLEDNGFALAEYDTYNSYASENGRGGDLLYADGIIKEVLEDKVLGIIGIVFSQTDEGDWFITAGTLPVYDSSGLRDLVGKEARVYFEYLGFSNKVQLPSGSIVASGEIRYSMRETYTVKFTPEDERCVWILENGNEAVLYEVKNGVFQGPIDYIYVSGIVAKVHKTQDTVTFSFYEKNGEDFVATETSAFFVFSDRAEELEEGDNVILVGSVNADNEFMVLGIEETEVGFSLSDIIQRYKDTCETYDYKTVARDPELYKGKQVKFTGEVIQVLESGDSVILRVNVTKGKYVYEDTIYVEYTRKESTESRILEDDIITLYGTFGGLKTYETVIGGSATIPKVYAEYIDIIQ